MVGVYFLLRAYPLIFMLPILNIPIVNNVAVRVGTNLLEKTCITFPIYAFNRIKQLVVGETQLSDYPCILITNDEEFSDYENITFFK
jgi:hypothetical protein